MTSRYTLLISLLICAVGCGALSFSLASANTKEQQNGDASWLTGLDFKLESSIGLFNSSTHRVTILNKLTEYYSNDQKRAVLEINQEGRSYKNVRYTYHGNNQLVRQGRDASGHFGCKLATNDELAQDLFGDQLNGESFRNLKGDQEGALPDYLIGPARLGFWVRAIKAKLIPTIDHSSKDFQSIPYKYRYDFKQKSEADGGEFSDILIYEAMVPGRAPRQLPLGITIRSPMKDELIFKYSSSRLLDYHGPLKQKASSVLDRFMVPLNKGCSDNFKPIDMLQVAASGLREPPLVVSFRTNIKSILHPMYLSKPTEVSYFVAYDGHAGVMRRDTISVKVTTGAPTHDSILITDFHRRRKYNIRQLTSQKDEMGLIKVAREVTESQCVATRIYNERALMSMDQILPFDSMVEMGQTTVRGVKCMVYETSASGEFLPPIFFPATSYISENHTSFVTRNEPIGMNLKGTGNYTMVYFFAIATGDKTTKSLLKSNEGKPLGPLLRVEIYHESSMVHEIEVEGFVWQLMDAPNGDRASELFNIRDKCSSYQLVAESFASLNMELEAELGDTKSTNPSDLSNDRKQLARMLDSPIRRNEAIYRALVQNTSLTPTQIHDLESRVHHLYDVSQLSNDRMVIRLNAKLVRPSTSDIYEVMNVGRTSLTSAIKAAQKYQVGAMNFADCYWEAVHKQRHDNNVVFAYCFPYCAMEDGVSVEKNTSNNSVTVGNMQKFALGEKLPCPVYLVSLSEQEEDAQYETTREQWFWSLSQSLRKQSLVLSILQEDGSSKGIEFSPRKVEIGSDRWSVSGTSSHTEEQVLEGVGLVAAASGAGSGEVIQVAPKRRGEKLEDQGEELEEEEEGAMSYALCHTSCVSSFDCKSFSLCSTSGQLQCLLSGIEFRDSQILEQIEQKSAQLRSSKKRGTITVQYKTFEDRESDGDVGISKNQTEAQGSIDLRVDRRCHLYNKRALELFSPASLSRIVLENRNLIAIDSEEQCAELCLRRNMLYFRRAALIRANYMDSSKDLNTNGGEKGQFMAEFRAKEERNLRSWCDSFAYMESGRLRPSDSLSKVVAADKLDKIGLCHIKRPKKVASIKFNAKNATKTEAHVLVDMHRYEFIYSSLYEPFKQPGLMLLGAQVIDAAKLDELKPEEAQKFLNKGNNQASMPKQTPEACARICFMQSIKLRPWCRSFGFTQTLRTNPSTGEKTTENLCIFNSNTMANMLRAQKDSKASDGVNKNQPVSQVPSNIIYQHYEPKNLLSLDDVVLSTHLTLDAPSNDDALDRMTNGGRVQLHTIGVVVLISLALISGLSLGVALSVYLGRTSSRRNSYDSQDGILPYNTRHIPHKRFVQAEKEFDLPELDPPNGEVAISLETT